MPTEPHHLAIHPDKHLCAQCENATYIVTPENGFSVRYPITENVDIQVFLHNDCAQDWSRAFGVELSKDRCFLLAT
jgi:hypothetical protein